MRHFRAESIDEVREEERVEIVRRTDTKHALRFQRVKRLGLQEDAVNRIKRSARRRD